MYRICLLVAVLSIVGVVESTISFPSLGLSYTVAQLTPRGRDHPVVILENETMIFESELIPPEHYIGKVLFMPYRPYWDEDVCMYESMGVKCVVIPSNNPYTAGSNINKGYNKCVYSCAFEMIYTDFAEVGEKYGEIMEASLGAAVIKVDIDGSEGNEWKNMAWSPLYWINTMSSGAVCLLVAILCIIVIVLMVKTKKIHMAVWLGTACFLIGSFVSGELGLIDFNCFLQILPYRSCNIFSSIRPPFVYAAVNLQIYSMIDAGKMHAGVNYGFPAKAWVFWVLSCAYFAMEVICAVTITYLTEIDSVLNLLYTWLALELGFMTYTAILSTVVSIKTIIQIRRITKAAGKLEERKSVILGMMFKLITISSLTIIYVIFVGLVNIAVFFPWFLGSTFLVYNQILNVISLIISINLYLLVTKGMDKKTSDNSKDSNPSTKEGTTSTAMSSMISKRNSAIDLAAED